jgi:hypothetical protein
MEKLEPSDEEMCELESSCSGISALGEALPIIIATTQALAHWPSIKAVVRRWVAEAPGLVSSDELEKGRKDKEFPPWSGFRWWTIETWSLAMDIVASYLAKGEGLPEREFLRDLKEERWQAGGQEWKIDVIVATLFTIKKSGWFWGMLC